MKKIRLVPLAAFLTSLFVSSCTTKEVQPKANGLGSGMRDKI